MTMYISKFRKLSLAAAMGAAALFGWRFHRSRLVFGAVALGLAGRILFIGLDSGVPPAEQLVFRAVALLLPVTPLVLTMFSVDELMNKLVSILL